jgi:hypothetical protein
MSLVLYIFMRLLSHHLNGSYCLLLHVDVNYEWSMSAEEPIAVFFQAICIVKLSLLAYRMVIFNIQEIYQILLALHFNLLEC